MSGPSSTKNSPGCRIAFDAPIVLCDLEGQTYEAAAKHLGCPVGTVKSRLARGRERLRIRLLQRGINFSGGLVVWAVSARSDAAVSSALIEATARLATQVDVAVRVIPATVHFLMQGVLKTMVVSKLKMTSVVLLFICGLFSASACWIGPPTNAAGPAAVDPSQDASPVVEEPGATIGPRVSSVASGDATAAPSKPWETVVRIKIIGPHSTGFGSGTIFHSTPEQSLILTCAHIFKLEGSHQVSPRRFPRKIVVDLFDGKPTGTIAAQVGYLESVEGEAVDYDLTRDVGLIRIRPGRKLPASRVVPTHWQPRSTPVPMKMLSLGCSEGHDPTAWYTKILDPRMQGLAGNPAYEAIVCRNAPKQGRAGGGLFTIDGYLAGVCNYAEPESNRGFYATPRSIYDLLDRNGLRFLFAPRSVTESQLDELIRIAEEHLENHDRAHIDDTLDRLNTSIEERRRALQDQLEALDALYARRRDDLLHRAAEARIGATDALAPRVGMTEPGDRPPVATKPVEPPADQESRLRAVEQKLDRILKWMEEARPETRVEHWRPNAPALGIEKRKGPEPPQLPVTLW